MNLAFFFDLSAAELFLAIAGEDAPNTIYHSRIDGLLMHRVETDFWPWE